MIYYIRYSRNRNSCTLSYIAYRSQKLTSFQNWSDIYYTKKI